MSPREADDIPELWEIDRAIGLSGRLRDFVEIAWPHVEPAAPFVPSWHIDMLCEHYEAVLRGEIPNLVVNIPPGCSKSKLTCVFLPVKAWVENPNLRWIFGSFDQGLVNRDAGDSLELMQSAWFRQRWGDRIILPKVSPVELIENQAKGWRLATTPGGKATGYHANIHVLDDPTKPKNLTKVGLEEAKTWKSRTLATRWLKPALNATILIMQRLHCDDLAGQMIDEGAVVVKLPMEYNPRSKCVTKWGSDPRTEDGELLVPGRFSAEDVATIKKDLGPINAAAQLQQDPVPEGGAIFKAEWLANYWHVLPKMDQTILSVDAAFKSTADSDFVVLQVWGRKGPKYYLIDQVRRRVTFSETIAAIKALSAKYPKAVSKLIEDKANGSAIIDTLKKTMSGILPVNPEGGKEARANAVQPLFEAGDVLLPDPDMSGYEWVTLDFVPEALQFPRGRHDDQIDAATQALTYLQQRGSYLTGAMAALAKAREAGQK